MNGVSSLTFGLVIISFGVCVASTDDVMNGAFDEDGVELKAAVERVAWYLRDHKFFHADPRKEATKKVAKYCEILNPKYLLLFWYGRLFISTLSSYETFKH